jgi:hypothetical protein
MMEAGVPSCEGTGLMFCKTIVGVITHFAMISLSRPDCPDHLAELDVRIFALRAALSCASSPS